jgi:zinc transporter, ZIP family
MTTVGVLLAMLIRDSARGIAAGISFSTGIMVLVAVLELIPEAFAAVGATGAGLTTAAGAALLWLLNLLIPHSHLVPEHGIADTRLVTSVYLIVIELILHDVLEGFAMANAFVASPSLGLLMGLAIALHTLPEELAMALPAMTLRSRKFLLAAAVLSALAEPAGAIIGLLAVEAHPGPSPAHPGLNGHSMAFAAGAMLFVSLHELMPMARRYERLGWFGAGLTLSIVVHQLLSLATTGSI